MNIFFVGLNEDVSTTCREKASQRMSKASLVFLFAGSLSLNATAQLNPNNPVPLTAPTGSLLRPPANPVNPVTPPAISPAAIAPPASTATDKPKLSTGGSPMTGQTLNYGGISNASKLSKHRVRVISAKDLATMAARLAAAQKALEAEAKEQAKKDEQEQKDLAATLQIIAKLKVADSAKVSLKSPRVAWTKLDAYTIEYLDFDKNQIGLAQAPSANKSGGLTVSNNGIYCTFVPPEDGFYMADFAVESGGELKLYLYEYADVSTSPISQTTTVPAGVQHAVVTLWAVKSQPRKLILVSNQGFAFNSCEVTRLKSG